MINFTQNLYKSKWLELVFQNRNKTYGAYKLRQSNAETTLKALIIASFLFTGCIISPFIYSRFSKAPGIAKNPDSDRIIEVRLSPAPSRPKPVSPPAAKAPQVKTIPNPVMIIKPADQVRAELPVNKQAEEPALNSANIDANGSETIAADFPSHGEAIDETPKEDVGIYSISSIEIYPEFPGGEAAFGKFLSRNLRFPELAIENRIQGKILVSFVIEKNGELSNIKILRGIGAGCDEEAIRVLSRSPKWKAGVQNKQNVRVAYTIPINFRLPE